MLGAVLGLVPVTETTYLRNGALEASLTIETTAEQIKRHISEYRANDRDLEIGLAIVSAESDYRNVCNTNGCRYGIGVFQIVQSTFDEQCEGSPYIIEDNVKCGMKMIAQKDFFRWKQSMPKWFPELSDETKNYVLDNSYMCSCVSYMRELGHTFPRIPDPSYLQPNSPPFIGGIVLIQYPDYWHMGIINDIRPGGVIYQDRRLLNGKCIETMRWLGFDDKRLRGFYKSE